MAAPANKEKTKRKAPPHAWKPGQSGNPKGRPKDGQSWAAVWKECTEKTPAEVLSLINTSNDLGKAFKSYPPNVQMKYLVALRALSALMFDPQASMLNAIMDREDGKVAEKFEASGGIEITGFAEMLEKAYGNKENSTDKSG